MLQEREEGTNDGLEVAHELRGLVEREGVEVEREGDENLEIVETPCEFCGRRGEVDALHARERHADARLLEERDFCAILVRDAAKELVEDWRGKGKDEGKVEGKVRAKKRKTTAFFLFSGWSAGRETDVP